MNDSENINDYFMNLNASISKKGDFRAFQEKIKKFIWVCSGLMIINICMWMEKKFLKLKVKLNVAENIVSVDSICSYCHGQNIK